MKKLVKGIIKLVLFCVIANNLLPAASYIVDCYVAAKAYNDFSTSDLAKADIEPEVNFNTVDIDIPEIEVNIVEMAESYSDFVGMLYIPACDILLPVMQGENNEYYLHHTYDGKESSVGSLFLGYTGDLSNNNCFVYGHNMKSGQAFGKLDQLMNSENKMVYLYTVNGTYAYEAFAGQTCTVDSLIYATVDEGNHDAYVNYALECSTMSNAPEMENVGRMLSFSTCHGAAGGEGRLVITCALLGIY